MGSLTQRDVVAVLTRAPSAGGKSRLFAELGTPPDPALLIALLLDTLDAIGPPEGGPYDEQHREDRSWGPPEGGLYDEQHREDRAWEPPEGGLYDKQHREDRAWAPPKGGLYDKQHREDRAWAPPQSGLYEQDRPDQAWGPPSGGPGADVTRVVAVDPASACDEVRALVARDVLVIPQPDGTLGDRMAGVMRELLEQGARAVALIGSDLPTLNAAELTRAFALLDDDPQSVVLGPADDGGYYLIAARHVPDLFRNIEWGSRGVLEQTRAAAASCHTRLLLVDSMRDVDTVSDLITCVSDGWTDTAGGLATRTVGWAQAHGIVRGNAR